MGASKAKITTYEPLDNLEIVPTRVLLGELRRMRMIAPTYEYLLAAPTSTYVPYIHRLKAELAKRPHIPNKPEAKALRQQRAKEQRSR